MAWTGHDTTFFLPWSIAEELAWSISLLGVELLGGHWQVSLVALLFS